MIFDTNGKLVSEHMVLANMPVYRTNIELENAFIGSLAKSDATAFLDFCSRKSGEVRIYPLINLYPYHFAFTEKCSVGDVTLNIVFLSENAERIHELMTPTSESLRDILSSLTEKIIRSDCDNKAIIYPTPESILAINHVGRLDAFLSLESRKPAYCDIHRILSEVCRSFADKENYSDIEFRFTSDRLQSICIELSTA